MRVGGIFGQVAVGATALHPPCWEGAAWDDNLQKCVGGDLDIPTQACPTNCWWDATVGKCQCQAYGPPTPTQPTKIDCGTGFVWNEATKKCEEMKAKTPVAPRVVPATVAPQGAAVGIQTSSDLTFRQALPWVAGAAVAGFLLAWFSRRRG